MLRAAETVHRTDTGRQRRGNEDAAYARAPVFVVADGMGGAQAGEVASRIAVEAFEQGLPDSGSPEERLSARIREANARIHELSRTDREHHGMGTTLTAAYLDDTRVAIAHVGDSRAYLLREGRLQRLTKDHSLVGALVDEGKLTEDEAAEHPQRSIITRALGPEESVAVDTWSYPVRASDVLLLCSDGLTSMISEDRITQTLRSAGSLPAAADALIHEANEAGGRDNITVVLARLEEVGDPVEEHTIVGVPALRGEPAPSDSHVPRQPAQSSARVPTPLPQPVPPEAAAAARTAPTPARRRPRRHIKLLAALLATLIVVSVLVGAGYLASRQLYFVSTDSQGIVTIYRGLPYDLPAGIHLYESFYVSGVPASLVPLDRRASLFSNHLRSQQDADRLVRELELGRLSG